MRTKEDIMTGLIKCKERLDSVESYLKDNNSEIKANFYAKHKEWLVCDEVEKEISCDETGYKKLTHIIQMYINKQKVFIEKMINLNINSDNKFNQQIVILLSDCLTAMENELFFDYDSEFIFYMRYRMDFSEEYGSILLLANFSQVEENVVLIGGNGSGKSSLANALKGNDTENICVIPAQKTLYFSMNDMSMLSARKSDLMALLLENNINKSKTRNDYGYFQFQNNQFTKLIVAMKEQHTEYLIDCEEKQVVAQARNTIFGQLREVFKVIFPEIKLQFKSEAVDYLNCIKNEEEYHVNALSEGEKAVIYYAVSVLMAKNNSFIVVDEPETYLNPSLTNLLWDHLIKIRSDCQFIFITHSVDFVMGRSDSRVAWIKRFQYPNKWEFEFVEDKFVLPKILMTEILGSKKPVAFCEGDKSSLDYTIYRSILGDEYTIIPVGGHDDVIRNCEVIRESPWMNIDAIGIIDGDDHGVEKIQKLKEKNIIVLPFNEIEMFLLSDEIINETMRAVYPMDYLEKIEEFKQEFFKIVEKEKNKIALYNVTLKVNEFIATEKIQTYDSVESIENNLKEISEYDVGKVYTGKLQQISEAVKDNNYKDLLILCNLKGMISRGLANQYLDGNYEGKAVQQIQSNKLLKETLKSKYCSI